MVAFEQWPKLSLFAVFDLYYPVILRDYFISHEIRICLQLQAVFHGSCQPKITAAHLESLATRLAGCSCTDDSWCPKSRIGTTAQGVNMIYFFCMENGPDLVSSESIFLSPKYSG